MEHTTKMGLVPYDLYNQINSRQQVTQEPAITKLINLNLQLQELLDDRSIPVDVRLQQFDQLSARFRHLKENKPAMEMTIKGLPEPRKQLSAVDGARLMQVTENVAITNRPNAKALVTHMVDHPEDFEFDGQGRLMHEGAPIEGSNFVDLIMDLSRNTTQAPREGTDIFLQKLRNTHAPRVVIANRRRQMNGEEDEVGDDVQPEQQHQEEYYSPMGLRSGPPGMRHVTPTHNSPVGTRVSTPNRTQPAYRFGYQPQWPAGPSNASAFPTVFGNRGDQNGRGYGEKIRVTSWGKI